MPPTLQQGKEGSFHYGFEVVIKIVYKNLLEERKKKLSRKKQKISGDLS